MKHLKQLFFALFLFASATASAHSFEVDGIFYKTSGTTVSVTYKGNSDTDFTDEYSGVVKIPASVTYNGKTYSVTSIGEWAFSDCSGLTSIEIPNSVTSIDYRAFYGCSGLTSIEIPNSDTSIGVGAFEGCSSLTSIEIPNSVTSISDHVFYGCSSLTSIEIPSSVTSIGSNAFSDCSGLTSIEIPNSVTSIDYRAFYGCSGLTSIEIPSSVTSISSDVFSDCFGLTSIVIPNSVTSIGYSAFSGCSGLTSIEIPNSVTSIGGGAFSGCSGLTSIEIPSSVTSIGYSAFQDCSGLTGELVIPNSVTSIDYRAFSGCSGLTSIEIPNSVTSISDHVFYGCSSLTSIEIPSSVTSIEFEAFRGCSGLTSIEIPNSVTSIGQSAFNGCSGLTSIEIPNSVTSIGVGAFSGCSGLTSIEISSSVTSIGSNAFYGCSSLTSIEIPNSVTSIESQAFYGCSSLTSIVIPNSVTSIGQFAFSGCSSLVSVEIPNSVTSIGNYTFQDCSGLKKIISHIPADKLITSATSFSNVSKTKCLLYVPKGAVDVYKATSGWREFTVIAEIGLEWSVADGVLTIEGDGVAVPVFTSSFPVPWNSEEFNKVVIGSGITRIGDYAFYKYPKFIRVEMPESATPLAVSSRAFNENCVIMVPANLVEAYKNDAAWSAYSLQICAAEYAEMALEVEAQESTSAVLAKIGDANTQSVVDLAIKGCINSYDIIVIRDKMPNLRYLDLSQATVVASNKAFYNGYCTGNNDLGDYVFSGLTKLASVKQPESLTRIGKYAFKGCSALESIEIPAGVTSIGTYAFYGCSALESIEIPAGVTSIGTYAFYGCSALESIEIPAGVASIGTYAFYGCSALESVEIPAGVASIGTYAFYGCSALKEIKLPPTVQTIASSAFTNCTSLKEVRLPSSLLSVAGSVFASCNAITDVYTYTIEPTSIQENTFTSTVYQNATLHVPSTSYWNYYWDDGWKRFLSLTYFDEPYDYFYLNNDYTLDEESGYIDGTPDVDINAGGGLIVEGETGDDEDVKQELGDVNVNNDGNGSSGSIIGDNNLHIDNLYIKINVKGGRWYFFAFPFDIPFSKISMENGSAYVFRYYDGEERAKKGNGGWKDINENHLKAARGYIFQCSANDVLVLNIADVRFKKEDKYNELVEHVTSNLQDASWNFTGNPYLSYYDINNLGYDAPITVWNGSSYEAIRPGDDDYHFAPFEAFFVQKPEGKGSVDFEGDHQKTHKKAQATQAANAAKRAGASVATDRKLVNIAISGENTSDRTRVVFNDKQSLAYETACDAVKFESSAAAQLYTLDNKNVKYAINERPVGNGIVPVGIKLANGGRYTISAKRMDADVLLKDEKTGTVHKLAEGAYTFIADAGTDEARFSLVFNGGTTGVDAIASVTDAVVAVDGGVNIENATGAIVEIYTVAGALVASDTVSGYVALPAGAYVININGKSIKVVVK